MTPAHWTPIVLLIGSNLFMTVAWYGHLKFKESPLLLVILASWAIAFVEYCLAVPANRIGHAFYSAAELKTMQEVITLVIFAGFSAEAVAARLNDSKAKVVFTADEAVRGEKRSRKGNQLHIFLDR